MAPYLAKCYFQYFKNGSTVYFKSFGDDLYPPFFLEVLYCHLDMVSILKIFLWLLKQPETMEGNSELEIYQWFGVMKVCLVNSSCAAVLPTYWLSGTS